jgi:hypothetical protein
MSNNGFGFGFPKMLSLLFIDLCSGILLLFIVSTLYVYTSSCEVLQSFMKELKQLMSDKLSRVSSSWSSTWFLRSLSSSKKELIWKLGISEESC